ncbi:histidine kinase [Agaricicola taiwanensis]|uniref:histidine kinase n=1 Tax=Agaricicola taiwanensis TaxID=591372 RepID=A0A8J2VI26_9RHOB|nr:PAS domain-containing hybrid sensor histidine kinase/response regulator [Agaricicola taiwanensis]GGE31381.1 histidine kinase [Agaricicola taiwanensis]
MLQGWVVVAVALAYLGVLFAVASYGDRKRPWMTGAGRPYIYALSLGVYCTSWTFYGSVGLSSGTGFDFLPVYIGPALMFTVGLPIVLKIRRLAKAQNITSIADFIAARYGKSPKIAALVTLAAVIGTLPYIALQLKAISVSLTTVLAEPSLPVIDGMSRETPVLGDLSLFVAIVLAAFAILFGTRHVDATEHQDGLMLAIAMESVVKLLAFLAVGIFVVWGIFGGPNDLSARAVDIGVFDRLDVTPSADFWITVTFLSFVCALLLPRQFHVAIVESRSESEIRHAAWLYPAYLVAINLFVFPIALAGLVLFAPGAVDPDMFVLSLPLENGASMFAIVAFIGGLSAATAMVIVETVALAIMISNDIAVPLLLRGRDPDRADMGRRLLLVRRASIFVILLLGYVYYRAAGDAALASIGLLSFAAIAQLAPALFIGLIWKRATARSAIAGVTAGISMWVFTLLLPSFAESGLLPMSFMTEGAFGVDMLRPQALFGLDMNPLTHGVMWSMAANVLAYVLVTATRAPEAMERLQASIFTRDELFGMAQSFRLWNAAVPMGDLQATVARYLGEERTDQAFRSFARSHGIRLEPRSDADIHLLRFAEHLLASAIGAASSRLVLSILLKRRNVSTKAALKLLDDASAAIQYSRDMLQTALDHSRQGVTVFDHDLRLMCWNQEFRTLFDLPPDFLQVGLGLDEIIRFNAERGLYGPGDADDFVAARLEQIATQLKTFRTRLHPSGRVIEIRSNRMPGGGTVTTYTDISQSVVAEEALEKANETLEGRVRERTLELTRLNEELERAREQAEEANISKTRFLAAASHDLLQPLNAARLYVSSLVERSSGMDTDGLAHNIDASLEAVEEILSALLDLSRLDTGAMKPEMTCFRLDEMFRQLEVEFTPLAREKGLKLIFVPSSIAVSSDRRLLRRLLQNLISNALKYTPRGRVLVGCRRHGNRVHFEVHDTGVGIPVAHQKLIFKEFQRLDQGARIAQGFGLGLSIVERIARVLDHPLSVASAPGKGSTFRVDLPVSTAPAAAAPRRSATRTSPSMPLSDTLVLCIDNENAILDGMRLLLTGWGCRILTASSAAEAIDLLTRENVVPDVVIVDYHLDGEDGLGAMSAIRAALGAEVTGLLVTADRTPAVRDQAHALGLRVLPKPVKPAALRALLGQWQTQRNAAE